MLKTQETEAKGKILQTGKKNENIEHCKLVPQNKSPPVH